ncbi:MAG: hypothetical protein WCT77_01415 [Bacteroidota bacterium]
MNYSRLIHDYLDGELDNVNQDLLFSELAQNQDLRIDFSQQLQMQTVARNEMNSMAPPLEATNAIFSGLGFTIPSQDFLRNAGYARRTAILAAFLAFFTKNVAVISAVSIITLATGAGIYFGVYNRPGHDFSSRDHNLPVSHKASLPSVPISSSVETSLNNKLSASENSQNNSALNSNLNKRSISATEKNSANAHNYRNTINSTQNRNNAENTFGENNQTNNNATTLNVAPETEQSGLLNQFASLFFTEKPAYTRDRRNSAFKRMPNSSILEINAPFTSGFESTYSRESLDDTQWQIQFRRTSNQSTINVPVVNKMDWRENLSLGVFYRLSYYRSIAVELGYERFSQDFTYSKNGQKYHYLQAPLLFWLVGTYRLNMMDLGIPNTLYPYAQISGGGTTVGPLVKIQSGLTFCPVNLIKFSVGLEAGALGYNVDGVYRVSPNYGLTIGGGISF